MAGPKGKSQANLIVAAVFLAVAIAFFFGKDLIGGEKPAANVSSTTPAQKPNTPGKLKSDPKAPENVSFPPPIPSQGGGFTVHRVTPPSGGLASTNQGGIGQGGIGSQTLPTAPVVEETPAPGEVPIEIEAEATRMTPEETARALEAEFKRPPPELPDDLKAQLNQPPGELPDDLKAQLHAPPREIPEDIQKALKTPPRIVSIEEVNNPNYRRPDAAPGAEQPVAATPLPSPAKSFEKR